MGDIMKFAALNTKLQGMRSKLMGKSDYEAVKHVKTVTEMAQYLRENTHFKEAFSGVDMDELHRSDLELLLRKEMIRNFQEMVGFLGEEYRRYIKAFFLRFEVEDIQLLLRTLNRHESLMHLEAEMLHVKAYSHVNFERLLLSTNLQDFVEGFRGTIFEEVFRSMTQDDFQLREFHTEMNMDMIYYRGLLASARGMPNQDWQIVKESVGIDVDCINMRWIYRAKKFYKLGKEEILNYTLQGGRRISFGQLKDIVYADNFEQQLSTLSKEQYQDFFSKEDTFLEIGIHRYFLKRLRLMDIKNPMTIAKLNSYIHELMYEVADVISMIEGIRYGVNFEEFCIRSFQDEAGS